MRDIKIRFGTAYEIFLLMKHQLLGLVTWEGIFISELIHKIVKKI